LNKECRIEREIGEVGTKLNNKLEINWKLEIGNWKLKDAHGGSGNIDEKKTETETVNCFARRSASDIGR
jgi:hypothetical protein